MQKRYGGWLSRWWWVVVIAGYVIIGLWLLPVYRYQINPDGVSYLSVAQLYLRGEFRSAVNGYWGPLLSWLLMPGLALGWPGLLVAKLLNLMVGAGLLGLLHQLLRQFVRRLWLRQAALAALAVVVLGWAYTGPVTPDLLLATLLTAYAVVLMRYAARPHPGLAVAAGGLAGLAFLAKSYALPFFGVHFSLTLAGLYLLKTVDRRRAGRDWLLGLAAFAVIALPWIAVISLKYQRMTMGTSGAYNLSLVGPHTGGHPMLSNGLIPPPTARGVSSWDDPSYFKVIGWKPSLFPPHYLHFTTNLVWANLNLILGFIQATTVLGAAVLVLGVAMLLPGRRYRVDWPITFALMSGALYTAGYALVFVEDRYLWFGLLLLVMVGLRLLDQLSESRWTSTWRQAGLTGLFLVSLAVPAELRLAQARYVDRPVYKVAMAASKTADFRGKRVASDTIWGASLYMCYYWGAHYYGITQPATAERQLADQKIDYVVRWSGERQAPSYLQGYEEIFFDPGQGLHVYRKVPAQD